MSGVTDPNDMSITSSQGTVLRSILSYLRNQFAGNVALKGTNLTLTGAGSVPFNGKLYAGDAAWIEIGSVGAPAFQNGWVNFGGTSAPAAYRRMPDGTVRIKGLVKSGTVNATIFTLPAGYRAAETVQLATMSSNGSSDLAARLQIETNGAVAQAGTPAGYNAFCSVNCSFYAEA